MYPGQIHPDTGPGHTRTRKPRQAGNPDKQETSTGPGSRPGHQTRTYPPTMNPDILSPFRYGDKSVQSTCPHTSEDSATQTRGLSLNSPSSENRGGYSETPETRKASRDTVLWLPWYPERRREITTRNLTSQTETPTNLATTNLVADLVAARPKGAVRRRG
jgi:hypothetical protein